MVTLSLSEDQVVQLVRQLAPQDKQRLLTELTAEHDAWWQAAAREGEQDMRRLAASRGSEWESLAESQREVFVDKLLHEAAS